MIDFIKVMVQNADISKLKNSRHLNFFGEVNLDTGEVKNFGKDGMYRGTRELATYQGLKFAIYSSGRVFISGSLHKYWNKGEHNFNDFNFSALNDVLNDIEQKFGITPKQMKINALEIGVNIRPPSKTVKILKHCFLHSTKEFKWIAVRDEGRYIQAKHWQYVVKIYDKARHYRSKGYRIDHEILRFEIKYLKLEKLKKYGIQTVQDLLDFGVINCVPLLLDEWKKVLLYDFTIKSNCVSLQKYCNPNYWRDLTTRRSAFNKHRAKLLDLTSRFSEKIHLKIRNEIKQKGYDLVAGGVQIDPLYILSKRVPQKYDHCCAVTSLNISMQKSESRLLSHTGLYFYMKHHPKIFEDLKRKYLSTYWEGAELKKQIEEMAHNIRNRKNNLRLKQRKLYPPNQYNLFSLGWGA
ncbi:hypothetical protein [Marinifilum flexuosum]|uniref:Replication-associated protein G2P N-terminal domain-containing protein n=1 Tax=Marinifilum flexuosum TaxID=1117708 RepID=A0A419XA32_9BACT|nr:hypothetical protein [Marinifilum flexuosum]RKE04430.1 hypothetical protein BXY64_1450 [Marinifilum flexuosum]